jgi:hypothetical protein
MRTGDRISTEEVRMYTVKVRITAEKVTGIRISHHSPSRMPKTPALNIDLRVFDIMNAKTRTLEITEEVVITDLPTIRKTTIVTEESSEWASDKTINVLTNEITDVIGGGDLNG